MAILSRFTDIVKSNVNALLDKCEDPAKMIDQYLRDLREDLAEVKKETASIMAADSRAQRELTENKEEIEKYLGLARKALAAGNETDAKTFLSKKAELEMLTPSLQVTANAARANADKMRQMHDKLVKDIQELEGRKNAAKAKIAVAKAQEKMNDIYDASNDANNRLDAFSRMEQKADDLLDRANAEAELNTPAPDDAESLAEKYASGASVAVDAELAQLKAEMGL